VKFIPLFNMRRLLIVILLQFSVMGSWAQLTVNTSQTATQLVQNVLVGPGVTVSNVTFSGASGSIGHFTTGASPTNLGIGAGIIMSSGVVNGSPAIGSAVYNFADTDHSTGSDPDLQNLTADDVEDAAVLAFDFVPLSDTIKFRYVFASEEYPEWVSSSVNDVFGFFVSGPNPMGGAAYLNRNVALIPGTNLPVSIDNINDGSYSQLYVDNEGIGGTTIVYDGFTKIFTAWCLVVPCLQYHIKLAIGDAGDGIYDSGVFLEANSFSSTSIAITQFPTVPAVGNNGIEGCNDVTVHFSLQHPQTSAYPVSYGISGTAANGTDYTNISNSLLIPAGQTSVDLIIHPLMDGLTEGTETVVLTVQTSVCGNTQDIIVNIADNTPLVLQTSNDTALCGGSATLWAAASGGIIPYTYAWSNGLGSGTSVTVSPTSATTYTVSVNDACGNTATHAINIGAGSGNADAGNNVTLCMGQSTTLMGSGGSNYQWSNGATTSATTVSPVTTTTYYMTATGGCSGNDSVTVYVNPLPVVTAAVSVPSILMSESATLTATGANSYLWGSNPNDPSLAGQFNTASPTVSPLFTTLYTVVGTDANGCTASAAVTLIVIPVYPEVNFFAHPIKGCEPLIVQFFDSTMKAVPGASYLWDFGNGTASTEMNPLAYYPYNGIYDVTLTVTNPGGLGMTLTIPGFIEVFPKPEASFLTLPNREVTVLENTLGFFDRTIGDPTQWFWSFGDGDTSGLENVYHTYADTGIYEVNLIATNRYGCSDSAFTSVRVRPESAVFVPNAFTPNGDGRNDVFYVQGIGILEGSYIIRIFNRWGEEVFFSTDPEYSWDGTSKGGRCLLGTYVYLIDYTDLEFHTQTLKGTVSIYR